MRRARLTSSWTPEWYMAAKPIVFNCYCTSSKVYMAKQGVVANRKCKEHDWAPPPTPTEGQTGVARDSVQKNWYRQLRSSPAFDFPFTLRLPTRHLSKKCLTLLVMLSKVPISSRPAVLNAIPSKPAVLIKSGLTSTGEYLGGWWAIQAMVLTSMRL